MPLQPNVIERFLIRRGTIPGPLLDLSMSTFQFWALIGAMELGLFEHLDEQPLGVEALAGRTDASERGIERLVHALEPLGYLGSTNGRYRLSSAAEWGTVVILDQLAGVPGSKFACGVFSLLGPGLFLFSGGRNYAYETLEDWLSTAGFPHVSHQTLNQPGFSLVTGRKQPAPGWASGFQWLFGA